MINDEDDNYFEELELFNKVLNALQNYSDKKI